MDEWMLCPPVVLAGPARFTTTPMGPGDFELSSETLGETASEVCRCRFFPRLISRPGAAVTVSDLFLPGPAFVCFAFAWAFVNFFAFRLVRGGAGLDRVFIVILVEERRWLNEDESKNQKNKTVGN